MGDPYTSKTKKPIRCDLESLKQQKQNKNKCEKQGDVDDQKQIHTLFYKRITIKC